MKLPRDLSGQDLARLLRHYGYEVTRRKGSHIRLTSSIRTTQHHVTVPAHNPLKVGTLSAILSEIAMYLKLGREEIERELFGK